MLIDDVRTRTVPFKMASSALVFISVLCLLSPLTVAADLLQDTLFSGQYEFIDLSHSFDNLTVYWPNTENFKFTKKIENQGDWYAANEFAAGEHGGTHIDAPYHFFQLGKYVGDLTLDRLIVRMILVDVSSKVNGNPDYVLYKTDLDSNLSQHFEYPCVLIFKFGWSQYFYEDKYLGLNGTTLRFPGISAEVAEWIVSFKNVVGVGVDTASMDPGADTVYPVHKIFAKAGLYNMENVKMNTPINAFKCTALALPMKIGMGTGAPLRLVAICPKERE